MLLSAMLAASETHPVVQGIALVCGTIVFILLILKM